MQFNGKTSLGSILNIKTKQKQNTRPFSHVYWSTIHNSQIMESTSMFTNGQMDKMWHIVYTTEYYLTMKKGDLVICNNIDEPKENFIK